MHPRDFSSMDEMPPLMFPGVGCVPLRSVPIETALFSVSRTILSSSDATSLSTALPASSSSAPISSVVSERTETPPSPTSMSEATPSEGFAAMPDVGSDAPHSSPKTSSDTSKGSFFIAARKPASFRAFASPSATAFAVPPLFCMITVSVSFPVALIPPAISKGSMPSQPSPITRQAPTFGFLPMPMRVLAV